MDILGHILPNQRPHFHNSFLLNYNFWFSVWGPIFSRHRCKLCRKLRNALFRSKFNIFFEISIQISLIIFLKLSKTYSPGYFLRQRAVDLYVFESLKWKTTKIIRLILIEVINYCPKLRFATMPWMSKYIQLLVFFLMLKIFPTCLFH